GWLKSLRMLHIIRAAKLDFMKLAKVAFTISWLLIVVGIAWGVHRGKSVWGVDFAGGDNLILAFDQKLNVEAYRDKVRKTVDETGARDAVVQFQKEISTGIQTLRITTPLNFGAKVEQSLVQKFPEAKFSEVALDHVGPTVGQEIQKSAIIA